MSQIEITFTYEGINTTIECTKDQKFKDIIAKFKHKANAEGKLLYYMYNGTNVQNDELTFDEMANSEDKRRKKMSVLVNELVQDEPSPIPTECIVKSKDIICPECKENIKFKIDDYNILLYECKKKHDIDLFIDEFLNTQNINISEIICQKCNIYNKGKVQDYKFYRCNSCNLNLCPICYSNHDKNHKLINYDDKYYICEEHNKEYNSYCNDCKQDLCILCEQNHNKHNIIHFGPLFPNIDNIKNYLKLLKEKKDILTNEIKEIINKLNKIIENINTIYNIYEQMINKYNKDKINYEILYNINNVENKKIIKDIDNIINDNNIQIKFNNIINIYDKMNQKINIEMIYNIDKNEDDIRIFGEDFVKNNINNCKMIVEGKEYKLSESFNIKDYNKDKLTIILKDINNITNMRKMFDNCSLSSLPDISKWNTSNVKDMSEMFLGCESLKSLPDISNWNTSNVTNMSSMFGCCGSLTSLPDISKWDTSNVNIMSLMFWGCESLTSLPDISKWNTSNVKDMSQIFADCKSLKSLPNISKWDTSNVNNMSYMFSGCSSLSSLPDISIWNTFNVKDMSSMFTLCYSLTSLPDISKWNTSNVNNMSHMFSNCWSLLSLPNLSIWNTSKLKENDGMFEGCNKILKKPTIKRKKRGLFA